MNEIPFIHVVLRHFFPDMEPIAVAPHGSGHIHRTYRVEMPGKRYLLQQFNHAVFAKPLEVAANVGKVYKHLIGSNLPQAILTPVYTRHGESFFISKTGQYWRIFEFIEGGYALEKAETPVHAYMTGKAFGAFAAALHGLNPSQLYETIPGFHDSVARWHAFQEVRAADPVGRVKETVAEIDALKSHHSIFFQVKNLILPRRVVHNDAKIGNVLFTKESGEVLAVTDWDTIMPGTILADFGDLVRSIVNPLEEDDPNTAGVFFRLEYFEALCRGFLAETTELLSGTEKENLVLGAQWIILEQALRFLHDHLAGDVYYPVRYKGHNLARARNQIALFQSAIAQESAMRRTVEAAV